MVGTKQFESDNIYIKDFFSVIFNGLTLRVSLRLFMQAGHKNTYVYSGNHNFFNQIIVSHN